MIPVRVTKSAVKVLARMLHGRKRLAPDWFGSEKVNKLTICGASSNLGQTLALLLKQTDMIREVHLHDDCNIRGITLDLDHIDTSVKVRPNSGPSSIKDAFRQADIVVLTNGYDIGLTYSDEQCLEINGPMIYDYAVKIASVCPDAFVCILTPPINSVVPLFSEVMKRCQVYDPNKIFGLCSLTEMRLNAIVADYLCLDPALMNVPIIGGVSYYTSVPLFSKAKPYNEFSEDDIHSLATNILDIPKECKKLGTTAPLSTAYSTMRFILTLAAGISCCEYANQTAFVRSDVLPQVKYFASQLKFGNNGALLNYGLPKLNDYELEMLENALPSLERDIQRGLAMYDYLWREDFREELDDTPKKPFMYKTPCPPCRAPCLPTEVCQQNPPPNPCKRENCCICCRYPCCCFPRCQNHEKL